MKKLITIIAFILVAFTCFGKYRQTCSAKYMTQGGWSDKYTVEITFVTGYELNQATNSYNYNMYSVYAVIFWSKGEASIIKVSTYLTCGEEATRECITNAIGDLKGIDQQGREWTVCTLDYCY